MKKYILHLDLDTFFVSCERLIDSRLQKKPLLVGGTGDRGVVAACSYETRRFGIHSGMSMKIARRLCPEATIIRGNTGIYSKYSNIVTDIIKESVPIFEKASIDEFYADLSGMDAFFGSYKYASELRQRIIKESGLPISFGLSQNKIVSKVATGEAKPNNQLLIDKGFEKSFLADEKKQSVVHFLITLGLGFGFMLTQFLLWESMKGVGLTVQAGVFPSLLFSLTWIHAAHIVMGLIALLLLIPSAFRGLVEDRIVWVQNIGKFWHFLGVVWFFMYVIMFVF